MNLSNYFDLNIKEINLIAEKHKGNYERDVVVSNVFLYLSDKLDQVNEDNIKGYIIRWCSMLKHWNQNRCVYLMEEKKSQYRNIELMEVYDAEQSTISGIEFDSNFKSFLSTLSYMDRCILRDYYEEKQLDTIEDIMTFYTVKRRQAFEIKKKINKLELHLYKFIKDKQC